MTALEAYMEQKGFEYRTVDKSRAGRIYGQLKSHIKHPRHTIQVLGTNGKGSMGRFLAQILAQNSRTVLHFTSPHIFRFSERFYKNGAIVSDYELETAHRFLQKFDFIAQCSYFEYATFLALILAQDVDYLILEAGVGGELDSTSVVARDVCVFSVIDYDHIEILGDSIEKIAQTKLNAVFYPNKVPKMVLGVQKYEVVEQIAREIAEKNGVELCVLAQERYDLSSQGESKNFNELTPPPSPLPQGEGEVLDSFWLPPTYFLQAKSKQKTLDLGDSHNSIQTHYGDFRWQSPLNHENFESHESNEILPIANSKSCVEINDSLESKNFLPTFSKSRWVWAKPIKNNFPPSLCGRGLGGGANSQNHKDSCELHNLGESQTPADSRESQTPTNSRESQESKRFFAYAQNDKMLNSRESQSHSHAIAKYLKIHSLAFFLAPNLALALKTAEILGESCDLANLPKLDLRGRFEQITPNITIDVGHNQNAALAIRQNLGQKKVILVYNSYFQKNISEILSILKDNILRVEILDVADNPRIIKKEVLEQTLKSLKIPYQNFNGINPQNHYLVFGSFSVVEAFMRKFRANR